MTCTAGVEARRLLCLACQGIEQPAGAGHAGLVYQLCLLCLVLPEGVQEALRLLYGLLGTDRLGRHAHGLLSRLGAPESPYACLLAAEDDRERGRDAPDRSHEVPNLRPSSSNCSFKPANSSSYLCDTAPSIAASGDRRGLHPLQTTP